MLRFFADLGFRWKITLPIAFLAVLVLLPLAVWAVWVRRDQYGWTESRYLRLALLVALAAAGGAAGGGGGVRHHRERHGDRLPAAAEERRLAGSLGKRPDEPSGRTAGDGSGDPERAGPRFLPATVVGRRRNV